MTTGTIPQLDYEVAPDKIEPNAWRVEAINYDGDGEVYAALFMGPDARARAEQYASSMNAH